MKTTRFFLLFVVCMMTLTANAIIDSGSCGENVTWVLNDDGTLVIKGEGPMKDYEHNTAPWYKNKLKFYTLVVEEGVTSIGSCAFSYCPRFTTATIANTVEKISNAAFYYCTALTSISIPSSVKSIGLGAFANCSSMLSFTVPNTVTSIGESAFYSDMNVIYSGSALGAPWGAKTFNGFPDGLLVYSDEAKTRITACLATISGHLDIPNSTESIANRAFSACKNLTSVSLPSSLTNIADWAFSACSNLTEVYSYAENPPALDGPYVFNGCPMQNATLFVPTESLESYRSTDVWKDFGKIYSLGNRFYLEDFSMTQGETMDVNITLQNVDAMSSFQADVFIPEYLSVVPQYDADVAESVPFLLTSRKSDSHELACTDNGDGTYHLQVVSTSGETFAGNDGALVTFKVKADRHYFGTAQIKLTDVSFVDSESKDYPMNDCVCNVTIIRDTNIASGISGTCKWVISEEGTLTILPIEGDSGTLEDWGDTAAPWSEWASQIKTAKFENTVSLSTGHSLFAGCSEMQSLDLTGMDAQNVTDVELMFTGCTSLSTVYANNVVPSILNKETFTTLPTLSTCTLFVPKASLRLYKLADGWEMFSNIFTKEPNLTNFFIADQKIERGTTKTVSIDMENLEDVASFQMDIELPEGMSFVTSDEGKPMLTNRAKEYSLSSRILSNGNLRVVAISLEDESIVAGNGSILTFDVNVPDGMTLGKYAASLLNIVVTPYAEDEEKEIAQKVDWSIDVVKSYIVSVSTEDEEKGIVAVSGDTDGKVLEGETVTFTATANEGYEFTRWSNDVTENPYRLTVMDDIELTAYFTPKNYEVTFNVDGVEETQLLPYRSLIAKPDDPAKIGYVFMGWSPWFVEGATVPLGGTTYTAVFAKKGDLDRDDELDVSDVTRLIRYILNNTDDPEQNKIADVNADGDIDVLDVTLTVRCILYEGVWTSAKSLKAKTPVEFHMTDFVVDAKRYAESNVMLTGNDVTNLQFDITVPKGVRVSDVSIAGCTSDHVVYTNEYKDGTVRVLCVSLSNEPICMMGNNITIALDAEGAADKAEVVIENIVMTTVTAKTTLPAITKPLTFTTSINAVEGAATSGAVYNALGIKQSPKSAGLNIIRKDNKNVKVFKK